MNIITNYSNVSIVTTNPATDSAARDSAVRPVVPPVATTSATNSETASDKERQQSTASVIPSKDPTYEQPQNVAVNTAEINGEEVNNSDVNEQQDSEQDGSEQENDSDENRNNEEFTEEEQQQIEELKNRDIEVVTHELAHANAGGQYAGSPSYTYETGPDGVKYAVSGEVQIDTSKIEGDPEATLLKAQQVKRAALAPAEPSGQDRVVASVADQLASEARQEIIAAINDVEEDTENTNGLNSDNNIEDDSVEDDSVGESSSSVEDDAFQQTIANRSQHINNFYQQSSQASEAPSFQQQI